MDKNNTFYEVGLATTLETITQNGGNYIDTN